MDPEELKQLILKAAAEFNAGVQKQAYENAMPAGDAAELSVPQPRPLPAPRAKTPLPPVRIDRRLEGQIKERLLARGLDLDRRRAAHGRKPR
jgi:hypothetical protein